MPSAEEEAEKAVRDALDGAEELRAKLGMKHVQRRELPPGHVAGGGRLPAPGEVADLTKADAPAAPPPPSVPPTMPVPAPVPVPVPVPTAPAPAEEEAAGDDAEEQRPGTWWAKLTARQQQPEEPADGTAPAPAPAPAAGQAAAPQAQGLGGDRSMKWIAFNGSAAAVGYGTGLVHWLGGIMPAAHDGPVGILSLALAAGGGWAAWKFLGHPAARAVLPYSGIVRLAATIGNAELLRRLAPPVAAWIDRVGTSWGLDPVSASLLLTAAAVNGTLYLFVDRPARHQPALVRWVLRIPLASTALACLLYAPGTIAR